MSIATATPTVVQSNRLGSMSVEPMTCSIGALLSNVNLGDASRDDALFAEIRALLLRYKVLFLHDQDMTRAEHVAFARRFGELEDHPVVGSDPEHRGLVRIYKGPDSRNAANAPGDLNMLPGAVYQDPKFSFASAIGITSIQFLHGSILGPGYDDAVLIGENNNPRLWLLRLNAARDRGVNEFLAKPVTATNIVMRLNAVIFRPRSYVQCDDFFGPDRRRRVMPDYAGPRRRAADRADFLEL